MMQIRASSVGKLMAYPEKNTLPDGALTYINELASQIILNWKPELDLNAINKGKQCEDEAIALYNAVTGFEYVKNGDRITTDLLTGEWDICDNERDLIIDIKTAYSKKTFPIVIKEGDRKLYEWQLTAYMHLKNMDNAKLVYVLVDTPDDLISKREPRDWHKVSDINPKYRVTEFSMTRDTAKERQMIDRCKLAQMKIVEILDSLGYDWGVISAPPQKDDDFII